MLNFVFQILSTLGLATTSCTRWTKPFEHQTLWFLVLIFNTVLVFYWTLVAVVSFDQYGTGRQWALCHGSSCWNHEQCKIWYCLCLLQTRACNSLTHLHCVSFDCSHSFCRHGARPQRAVSHGSSRVDHKWSVFWYVLLFILAFSSLCLVFALPKLAKLTLGTLSITPSAAGAYVTGDLFIKVFIGVFNILVVCLSSCCGI